jgi:hypothetical protein
LIYLHPTPGLHVPEDFHLPPVLQRHLVVHLPHRLRLPPLALFFCPIIDGQWQAILDFYAAEEDVPYLRVGHFSESDIS